ncbi:hypothetical protein [Endozoicomonas sp. YOMI1]|uniref:hypothetical protein n=1 Tax=Endozoicomonas sp. YOMI1 TaxID=2828739 RepID=UPI002147BDE8|nr:hypothetical protein [Endozoicomonas sp. YOMI1]
MDVKAAASGSGESLSISHDKSYAQSEKTKASKRAWAQSKKGQAYAQSEKRKAYQRIYQKAYYEILKNTGDEEQAKWSIIPCLIDEECTVEFTEEYEDVLQNLEYPIMNFYYQNPILEDWDVKRALEATIEHYRAEFVNRPSKTKNLSLFEQQLSSQLITICEWRLGRATLDDVAAMTEGYTYQFKEDDFIKTSEELQKCLKRIIKSVKRWNRVGGKQGYLNFTAQYFSPPH